MKSNAKKIPENKISWPKLTFKNFFIKNYNMSANQHYYNSLSYCLSLYSVNISFNDRYLLQD